MELKLDVKFSHRQTEAYDLLESGGVTELLYGGAKGGGKSAFGCLWVFLRCLSIIAKFGLPAIAHPIPVGFMGRKRSVDFTKTTLETWKQLIPAAAYRIREQQKEIIIGEAVKLDFGGLDTREDLQKFNSAEYAFFFLDQAEEATRDDVSALRTARRRTINGVALKHQGLYTANPRNCWLRDDFILKKLPGHAFVRALHADNPWLPPDYVLTLQMALRHRPELLAAYLEGDWNILSEADQVIRGEWIELASKRRFHVPEPRILVVCDVARFGDDETVIYTMEETQIIDRLVYGQKDTMHTANAVFCKQREVGGCLVVVDGTGVGGGVADRLREMGCNVLGIESAAADKEPAKFINRRAGMWWRAGQAFAEGAVALTDPSEELAGQLTVPTYSFASAGRIKVESKDDIKARLGRSPDHADAYVMGLDCLEYAEPRGGVKAKKRDVWAESPRHNAMAM